MSIIEIPTPEVRIGDKVARASTADDAVEITLSDGTTDRVVFINVEIIEDHGALIHLTNHDGYGIVTMPGFTEYVIRD